MNTATPVIAMDEVASSQIFAIGHDAATSTLAIRFKAKGDAPGSLYHYQNFSAEDFEAFRKAESIGRHFKQAIKPFADRFPYQRIEDAPKAD